MTMWEYIAGDLPYVLPYALLYLIGIVVAAFNIRRAGAAAFMVLGALPGSAFPDDRRSVGLCVLWFNATIRRHRVQGFRFYANYA